MSVEKDGEFLSFDLQAMPRSDSYKLLASVVVPRPIAWIVTEDAEGRRNAAPFSFFNVISSDPPMVAVSFSGAPDREGKDTFANIRASGEFVVNTVSEELAAAMNLTAINAPRGTDETELAGLELAASEIVKPPRIARSPAAFECRVWQLLEPGGTGTIMLAHVLRAHVRRDVFADEKRLHVDGHKLGLIGRMQSPGGYCRTQDVFELERPAWK